MNRSADTFMNINSISKRKCDKIRKVSIEFYFTESVVGTLTRKLYCTIVSFHSSMTSFFLNLPYNDLLCVWLFLGNRNFPVACGNP